MCDDGVGSLSGKWMLGDDQLATQCASAVAAPDSPSSSLMFNSIPDFTEKISQPNCQKSRLLPIQALISSSWALMQTKEMLTIQPSLSSSILKVQQHVMVLGLDFSADHDTI